jgi:predicted Zn-dependent peptidase
MEFKPDKYKKFIHQNGLEVVHVKCKTEDLFYIELTVRAGSLNENKEFIGFAHALEHMMSFFTSEKDKDALKNQNELFNKGIESNAWTGHRTCGYYMFGLKKHKNRIMELLLNNLTIPYLDESIFKQETKAVLRELDNIIHNNWYNLDTKINEVIYNNTNLIYPVKYEKHNVKNNLNKENLLHFRNSFYKPELINILVVSNEDCNGIKDKIFSYYNKNCNIVFPIYKLPIKLPKLISKRNYYIKPNNKRNLCKVVIIFKLNFNEWSNKKYKLMCLDSILTDGLGSKLYKTLRSNLGAVYNVKSDIQLDVISPEMSFYRIETETTSNKLKDVIDNLLKVLFNLEINVNEVNKYKNSVELENNQNKGSYDYDKYSSHYSDYLLWNEKIETIDEIYNKKTNVDRKKVNKFSKRIFTKENMFIFYSGNTNLLKF